MRAVAGGAHGCERSDLFGWYYTIAFSPSLELDDLIGSVKELYSVAVEGIPGESVRPHRPFRLAKYALFLLREVLPLHHELRVEEARLMMKHLTGNGRAAADLRRPSGRTARMFARLWHDARRTTP